MVVPCLVATCATTCHVITLPPEVERGPNSTVPNPNLHHSHIGRCRSNLGESGASWSPSVGFERVSAQTRPNPTHCLAISTNAFYPNRPNVGRHRLNLAFELFLLSILFPRSPQLVSACVRRSYSCAADIPHQTPDPDHMANLQHTEQRFPRRAAGVWNKCSENACQITISRMGCGQGETQ